MAYKIDLGSKSCKIALFWFSIVVLLFIICTILGSIIVHSGIKEVKTTKTETKEGMAPAQRFHLAHAYSKIGSDYPQKPKELNKIDNYNKFDTTLKNPTNGRRKLKNGFKLYNDVEHAGNPMSVARGGMPMNYELKNKLGKNANMQALDVATLNGNYGNPPDPNGGKSDIVPLGNSTRMAGSKQDLSPFLGITSAKR